MARLRLAKRSLLLPLTGRIIHGNEETPVNQMKGQLQLTSVFTTLTFVERTIMEFAPCRLPQKKMSYL